jgi:hypothetical protein
VPVSPRPTLLEVGRTQFHFSIPEKITLFNCVTKNNLLAPLTVMTMS